MVLTKYIDIAICMAVNFVAKFLHSFQQLSDEICKI